ncbi:N-acetyltransferase [Rhodoblastus acidophilus]|uniref:N-acetyltransferase n=1 Tax=Candidatus Rhodoblastus alkanivorans TaxID=2954117 RepID=A0ABS9Z4T1_9HYPH|nr:N-acetyltransferase [Candidatus Rhodoblastus alkanivorans]MCI4677629.1 N-acetyltransferase [Candidatus Rhodoblastus alkanivorans]MCI4682639.1 N-acetyltransferase [Candidatus Rhodoblastus alkanivorans]MDI4639945.1 N-acetyltransferase [Rhodoblastus acidophilus]
MPDLSLNYSNATPADRPAILKLEERAFGPGRFAKTAYRLREGVEPDWSLSFLARIGGMLVGANTMTRILIGGAPALLLGPLTVEEPFRAKGLGEALAQKSLSAARDAGHSLVILVGDPPLYERLGFVRAPFGHFAFPGPVDPGRILFCELQPGALQSHKGAVRPAV